MFTLARSRSWLLELVAYFLLQITLLLERQIQCTRIVNRQQNFVTEMKTREAYRANETWYWKSRACQATAALYYSRAPVLLCSPACFKVLVLMEDMDNINYYPAGAYSGLTSSETFRLVVGLLILSQRVFSTETTIKVPSTPPTLHVRPKEDTAQKRKRRRTSTRNTGTSKKIHVVFPCRSGRIYGR